MCGSAALDGSSDWRQVADSVRNWGRWGTADQKGTLNLISQDTIRNAAALVRRGAIFDLGIPFDDNGPQVGGEGRKNPLHLMTIVEGSDAGGGSMRFNDDYVVMPLQAATQWDALSHIAYEGKHYNDTPTDVVSYRGADRLGIEQASAVVGRGVLLDVARHLGVDWLQPGQVIDDDLLDQVVRREKIEIRKGDILLLRTGWRAKLSSDGDRHAFMAGEPGLGLKACRWLHENDIAAVASDNWAVEVVPGELADQPFVMHMILIRDMGLMLGEMFDFEALAEDCQADDVYECFFSSPVLRFTGAVGAPASAIAIK